MRKRNSAEGRGGSWLARLEERLKTVVGPAAVSPVGAQPQRSADRLDGSGGDYEVHRDSRGVPYLVVRGKEPGPPGS